ncbi:hypothetical protein A9W96_27760 [Mycobacterium sp. 1245852.3]|nr:hypothetical protein A9W96_27760 [Mycobacterium sp. 1245852.3]
MRPRFGTVDGITVRFARNEPRNRHALLLSPWPESLYAYGRMWPHLTGHAHVVAVDLPGFGAPNGATTCFPLQH